MPENTEQFPDEFSNEVWHGCGQTGHSILALETRRRGTGFDTWMDKLQRRNGSGT